MFTQICFHLSKNTFFQTFFHPVLPFFFFLIFSFSKVYAQKNLSHDTLLLQQAVIQATRASERSAVPHSNFSQEKITKIYHAQDLPFVLSGVPSLVENSDAGTGIGYTGFRIRGSDPTRVNITFNGIPFNDAESQGTFLVNVPDLVASAAEVQVQRGVGTSTNGAGAFGATINLDLSRVDVEPSAVFSNTFGAFGTRKHSLRAATGLLGGGWHVAARLSKISSDGFIDRATADLEAAHLSAGWIGGRQTMQAHLIAGKEKTYQAWNGVPAQYLNDPTLRTFNTAGTETPDGVSYPDEVDNYTQRHHLLHYKIDLRRGLFLQVNGFYTRGFGYFENYKAKEGFSKYNLQEFKIGDSLVESTDLVRRRWLDNHFYGSTFALRWQPPVNPTFFSAAPKFTLGGAASRYDGLHFGEIIWAQVLPPGIGKDFRYYENEARKLDGNLFFQSEISWRGGWTSLIDLQARKVNYYFEGFNDKLQITERSFSKIFFNPKLGFYKKIDKRFIATSYFGIANREPNREDFTQSSPTSQPLPERLFDTEIGFKFKEDNLKANLNFFRMDYKNQLVLDGSINDVGAYTRINVPRSHRMGIEIEADATVADWLQIAGNLSLSQNRIKNFTEFLDNWDTGEQEQIAHRNTDLAFSPRVVGRLESTFSFLKNKKSEVAASLAGKLVGRQFLDNTSNLNTSLPRYFTLDLRLRAMRRDFFSKEISLLFSLNNLLDARFSSNGWTYRFRSEGFDERPFNPYTRLESGSIYNQTGYFPQAGRHWMATLTFNF